MADAGTIILGAGLAGLGCARALPGAHVFEALPHPGGHAWSHEVGGVYFDEGAHICHAKDPTWLEMLYGAAGDVEHIAECQVANYTEGKWITYPVQNNLRDLSEADRQAALRDFEAAQSMPSGREPANYHEWCLTQYGRFLTEKYYRPYTNKYWRVPMEEMATDWLGGRLLPAQVDRIRAGARAPQKESQAVFARFHYPARGGFFSFFKPLYAGLNIQYGKRAVEIHPERKQVVFQDGATESYQALASSIPLPELVRIVKGVPVEVAKAAAKLRHVQLLCVNMIIECADLTPHHWFYIYDEDVDVSRVKVNSNVAPQSVPDGHTALQVEIFRRMDEPLPVDVLTEKAVKDLERILGFGSDDVRIVRPVHVPYAYVISDLHRASAVDAIIPWLEAQGIYPMGLFGRWKFIWSDAAYQSGMETAERMGA